MVFTREMATGMSKPQPVKGHFHNRIEVLGEGNYLFHWKECKIPKTNEKSLPIPDLSSDTAHNTGPTLPKGRTNTVVATATCNPQNINNVKVRNIPLVARKTLSLPGKKIPFSPDTYRNRPKYQAVFEQPKGMSGVDVKLVTVSTTLDKTFLEQHCIENGNTKTARSYRCWNCRSCHCEMLSLSGQSQQAELEIKLVKANVFKTTNVLHL